MKTFLTESVQNIFSAKNWVDHETARLDFQPLSNCKSRIGGGKILSDVKEKNKSERPGDALVVKTSLTDSRTTWNQEMLAHLKIFSRYKGICPLLVQRLLSLISQFKWLLLCIFKFTLFFNYNLDLDSWWTLSYSELSQGVFFNSSQYRKENLLFANQSSWVIFLESESL